jgi:hypothetical protein
MDICTIPANVDQDMIISLPNGINLNDSLQVVEMPQQTTNKST